MNEMRQGQRDQDRGQKCRRSAISNLRFLFLPFAFCLLPLIGCQNFGTGGTGEMIVPETRLRQVEALDLSPDEVAVVTTLPATQPATQPVEVTIMLDEVRQMALHNNLSLQVFLLDPTISQAGLSEAEAQFEWLFVANADYSTSDSPTASQLSGSSVKNLQITPGLQIPLQTGGTIRLDVPMNRLETDNQFSTLNPAYTSDVSASISQPLLRGAGVDANASRIRIAFYDYQISQARTNLEVIRVLAAAERVYWRLYAAREDLKVKKKQYDLAVAQLERARRQVQLGAAAEVEIVRAESGVADTVEAIINAENLVRNNQRDLKRIINQPGLEMGDATIIVTGTLPRPVAYRLDPARLVKVAVDNRMEMLELELRMAQDASNVAFARNATLPLVTLDYVYGVNGLGSSFNDSFSMVGDKNFEDHRIGLQVQVPIGNEAARSRLRQSLAVRLRTLATREQQIAAIRQEVYNALDQLEANWQRILAARQRVVLAARVLDAEVRQFNQQLRTSTDVLNAQTSLADAQSAEIAAITEYQIAQVDIAFATGMLLGQSRVSWAPTAAPKD
jgi:outer membrane protein TolC